MKARLIENMPAETYHADPCELPSLSSHVAQTLLDSTPRKAWLSHPRLNKNYVHEETERLDIGTLAHALLLEEDDSKLVIVDAADWRTKAAKEARDEARVAGKIPLLPKDATKVREMVEVARAYIATTEFAKDWKEGRSEQTIVWEEDGVHLRCRLDKRAADFRVVFDYKTSEDVSPGAFTRTIGNFGYHRQDAFYRRGVRALGYADPAFIFFAQEKEPPYECALYGCDPMMREIGELAAEAAIDRWRECMTSGKWPGNGTRVHWAVPPYWMRMEHEERILQHG